MALDRMAPGNVLDPFIRDRLVAGPIGVGPEKETSAVTALKGSRNSITPAVVVKFPTGTHTLV